jgi:hypothetical protein
MHLLLIMRCMTYSILIQGDDLTATTTRVSAPLPTLYQAEAPRKITNEEKEFKAFQTLRQQRGIARNEGARKVKAAKVCIYLHVTLDFVVANNLCRRTRRRQQRRSRESSCCYVALLCLCLFFAYFTRCTSKPWVMHYATCTHQRRYNYETLTMCVLL